MVTMVASLTIVITVTTVTMVTSSIKMKRTGLGSFSDYEKQRETNLLEWLQMGYHGNDGNYVSDILCMLI